MTRHPRGRTATLACLVARVLAGSLGPAATAGADECLPLEPRSAARAAERAGLDEDQERWLLVRLVEGRVASPDDLSGMPGAGGELVDDLAALFCWEPGWRAAVTAAGTSAGPGARDETRVRWERGGARMVGRWQGRPEGDDLARIGVELSGEGWGGTAGHLVGRYGLGLAVGLQATRVSGPLRPAAGGWGPSLSADPDLPRGLALSGTRGAWTVGGFSGGFPDRTGGGVVSLVHDGDGGATGGIVGARGGDVVGSLFASRAEGAGGWALEWSRSARGSAVGGSWRVVRGSWRVEAGLARRGAGYRSPLASLLDAGGGGDESVLLALGIRCQEPGGGFTRVGVLQARRPDGGWGIRRRSVEIEIGRPLERRVRLTVLARSRVEGAEGAIGDAADHEQTLRAEVRARLGPGSWRVRGEERLAGDRLARWVTLAWSGDRGPWRWEVRGARVRLDPGASGFSWFRRRGGGLYGWDRIGEGAAAGVWGRLSLGRTVWEGSWDGGGSGWEGTMGLTVALGSGSP